MDMDDSDEGNINSNEEEPKESDHEYETVDLGSPPQNPNANPKALMKEKNAGEDQNLLNPPSHANPNATNMTKGPKPMTKNAGLTSISNISHRKSHNTQATTSAIGKENTPSQKQKVPTVSLSEKPFKATPSLPSPSTEPTPSHVSPSMERDNPYNSTREDSMCGETHDPTLHGNTPTRISHNGGRLQSWIEPYPEPMELVTTILAPNEQQRLVRCYQMLVRTIYPSFLINGRPKPQLYQ
ncbi:3-isopropylmalate dehydratase large subunit [Bienertia sinuspersici]